MKKRLSKKKILIFLSIILILIGLGLKFKKKPVVKAEPQIYTVQKGNLELSYTSEGKVHAEKVMSVYGTTNSTVKKVYHRIWENVKKGEILLDIDESSIDVLNSNIKIYKIKLNKLKNNLEKSKKLYAHGLISKNKLDSLETEYEISTIEYDKLLKEKSKIELVVKAPISGIITELNADDNYKIELSKPLFRIADTDNLKIVVSLPNVKSKNVKIGDEVYVSSPSLKRNEILKGKVTSIEKISSIDREYKDSVTNIIIKLSNNSVLKPGDLVNVKLIYRDLRDVLLIPVQYVLADQDGKAYVLEVENNTLVKKYVKLGTSDGFAIEVIEGLKQDDKVLNNSTHQFKEGDHLNDKGKQSK